MKPRVSRQPPSRKASWRQQAGAMIIEFALIAIVFFGLLVSIMELGRWLFTLNAAMEATRWGARLAVVCGNSGTPIQTAIQTHIQLMIRSGGTLNVTYPASTCTTDCLVTVTLTGARFKPFVPFLPASPDPGGWLMPNFSTTLSGEAMGSEGSNASANDVCPA